MKFLLPLLLAAPLILAACAGDDTNATKQVDKPVGNLYNDAYDLLDRGDYKKSADMFDEVERQHPYSQWASPAELMAAYAQYSGLHYQAAIDDLDRFIQLHPGNKDIAYAYYLKAECWYEQIGDERRDQTVTLNAKSGFEDVVRRFPDTPYAADAKKKIDLANERLAAKDMDIGRFYEKQGLYIAAISRFRLVVEQYQTTSHTPEALLRLVECYHAMGIDDEARKNAAVLGANYPASNWYKDAYQLVSGADYHAPDEENHEDWFDRAVDSFF
jgi:outer membrane protein assembly factor BamD